ncbi:hypothetical protein [Pasteurella multocida]|uniref:hypothetical protein n=1 Tax=Pasteurella multocida TaxID=747 RepID=UPI0020112ADB|nr:hypothetical protein [Pasteurella multocida]
MGFNESTGGTCWMCYSHSSYYAEVLNEFIIKNGIKERNLQYGEFTEKWGTPIKGNNPSIPILVKPNIFNTKEML